MEEGSNAAVHRAGAIAGSCGATLDGIESVSRLFAGLSMSSDDAVPPMRHWSVQQSQPPKLMFEIPWKTVFINAVKSLGFAEPLFAAAQFNGSFQVAIDILAGVMTKNVVGDVCQTYEMAEASAVKKAIAFLRNVHNVVLVDISARKEKKLISIGRDLFLVVNSGISLVCSMIKTWRNCLDILEGVVQFAETKLKDANPIDSRFANRIWLSLLMIKGDSAIRIKHLESKMAAVCDQKSKYVHASRSGVAFKPQGPITKAYFHDVVALDLLAEWLRLDPCQYHTEMKENGLYFGSLQLCSSDVVGLHELVDTSIKALALKATSTKALDAAAREAIYFLEDVLNVDVARINHTAKVAAEQEMLAWKGLKEEVLVLGVDCIRFWKEMVDRVAEQTDLQKNTSDKLALGGNEMAFIHELVQRLDIASAECSLSFKVSAAKFAKLK